MFSLAIFTTLTLGGLKTLTMANPIAQQITPTPQPDGYQPGYSTVSPCPPTPTAPLYTPRHARPKPCFLKPSSPLSPCTARLGTLRPTKRLHNQRRRLQRPNTSLPHHLWPGSAALRRLRSGDGRTWARRLHCLRDVL